MNKCNKILIYIIGFFVFISFVSAQTEYCYQEFADVSTACGGNNTGVYDLSGAIAGGWTNPSAAIDGDYATSSAQGSDNTFIYVNYTIPVDTTNAIWQVKDAGSLRNLTIPSNCFTANGNILQLSFGPTVSGFTTWKCEQGGSWNSLSTQEQPPFEEAMFWNNSEALDEFQVTLNSPSNESINNSNINFDFTVDKAVKNCTLFLNISDTWEENETVFNINESEVTSFPEINLLDGGYIWNVECHNESINFFSNNNFTLTIDKTSPQIIAPTILSNNKTIVFNGTLNTNLNFSDDREIYSIKVNLSNGTIITDLTNLGVSNYVLNISSEVDSTIVNSFDARVCDSHTAKHIEYIENKRESSGIKYVMKKEFMIIDRDWIKVYPKDYLNYNNADTTKYSDRYSFTFNRQTNVIGPQVFIVESSHSIDIAKSRLYGGHLIVKDIGENGYWIDFENSQATKHEIKRINDKKIEVTIYGLSGKRITFDSIGELNCISEKFYYNNINPLQRFKTPVLINENSNFDLNVSIDSGFVDNISANLRYNNTDFFVGNESNFTQSIQAPSSIVGNSQNISFFWTLNINNINRTLQAQNQTVENFDMDNCTLYSTRAINFTFFNEENNSKINADATGTFNFNAGTGTSNTFLLDVLDVSNFSICITPSNAQFTGYYEIIYSKIGFQERRNVEANAIYDNITQDQSLFLLENTEGIFARFRIINIFQQAQENVTVEVQKNIGGSLQTVEVQVTDASGLATIFINPNDDYTYTFSKSGFVTQTQTLRITSSDLITVTLESEEEAEPLPPSTGISYKFAPSSGVLNNNTIYNFNFSLSSSNFAITDCELFIKNESTTITQATGTFNDFFCNATIAFNTNNYTTLISEARYELNNSNNIIVTTTYSIRETNQGEFSLQTFIDDLKNFSEAGFNDFTRMFIALIVIFAITSWTASKLSAFRDPEALIILVWGLVFFFSYIGWLTINYDPIPTAFLKQYIILILMTLGGGAYLINKHLG
jgi:hypothetical protein